MENVRSKRDQREYHRAWRAANAEKLREQKRAYYAANAERRREYGRGYRVANIERLGECKRVYWAANAQKRIAQSAINNLRVMGRISSPYVCESCHNVAEFDAHHHDYAKPLEVTWLCRPCHKRWHAKHGEAPNGATPPYYHIERRYKVKRKRLKAILNALNKRPNDVFVYPHRIGV